jgi:hypothetical protein
MNKTWKVLLGLVSLLPLAFFAIYFAWLIPSFFYSSSTGGETEFSRRFDVLLPAAIAASVALIVLLLIYAVLLARRPDLQIGEKIGVPILILFSNGILLPLVWWLYIWRGSNLDALSRRSP